ncbi:XRE family transcriptional regulator [Candidatus Atribacteria bacterium 1244-E10-H5-B2]|nr:MAG: XRE family transcriptional regulator [Candidatus Atribacteria bacterium 1244-E10-H5-B2]
MVINPIKKRREGKGLTQANLALLLDITQIYVSQFETGGLVPSKKQIKKLVEILDLDEETFNKELSQFYQAKKKELKKQIKER